MKIARSIKTTTTNTLEPPPLRVLQIYTIIDLEYTLVVMLYTLFRPEFPDMIQG